MSRVRISTTVDQGRLERARRLHHGTDSQLMDRALATLVDALEAQMEIAALEAMPYDEDPELSWEVPPAPPLPYAGEIPADVLTLAERRRR